MRVNPTLDLFAMQSLLSQNIMSKEGVKIDDDLKMRLLGTFWPQYTENSEPVDLPIAASDLGSYFSYYQNQCHAYFCQRGRFVVTRTHQDVSSLISDFNADFDIEQIRTHLVKRLQNATDDDPTPTDSDETNVDRAIDLSARLFLMMRIGKIPHSITSGTPLEWKHGTLKQFVRQHFGVSQVLRYSAVKLPKIFNGHNLERFAGIKIKWTDNLADHMRMVDDDEKVAIFAHPTFLMLHATSDIFPPGFIDETLRTIKLLFPANNKPLQKWLQSQISSQDQVDKRIATCGSLRSELRHIEKFTFWRDRLIVLKEAFDEAEPSTLSQWWWDRRKRVQWYTFWIAVLVLTLSVIFGIIQSIASILQTHLTTVQMNEDYIRPFESS